MNFDYKELSRKNGRHLNVVKKLIKYGAPYTIVRIDNFVIRLHKNFLIDKA